LDSRKKETSVTKTNRRNFIGKGAGAAAGVATVVAAPAKAQDKPVKKVIYRNGKKPEKTPLFNGTVAYGNLIFIAGVGYHQEGDIKVHTKGVLDQIQQQLEAASAAVGLLANRSKAARTTPSSGYPFAEFEARIAKRDFRDMTKDILPTPCMVVDLDMFKANIKHMADTAKANGINVRPHVKVHKSVDVAKHQIAHGAIGLTCATIAEAELFSGAGTKGVLWTKQPVGTASGTRISPAFPNSVVPLSRRRRWLLIKADLSLNQSANGVYNT
jgi:hypothetical protein